MMASQKLKDNVGYWDRNCVQLDIQQVLNEGSRVECQGHTGNLSGQNALEQGSGHPP